MAKAQEPRITVGTSWTAGGRTYEVYELLPFGRARVRSGHRFGEMRFCDIRPLLAPVQS